MKGTGIDESFRTEKYSLSKWKLRLVQQYLLALLQQSLIKRIFYGLKIVPTGAAPPGNGVHEFLVASA